MTDFTFETENLEYYMDPNPYIDPEMKTRPFTFKSIYQVDIEEGYDGTIIVSPK